MKKALKIILIIIGVLLLLFSIFVGYVIYDTNKQEKILEEEMNQLQEIDLTKDKIDMNIKTTEEYAIIEKTIKTYLNDYSSNCKEFMNAILYFNYEEMFTPSTLQKDGPAFIVSKSKLSKLQETVKTTLNKLIEMTNEDYITKLITDKNIDEYYVDLYKDYMFGTGVYSIKEDLKKESGEIKKLAKDVNMFLDDCYKIYDFMSSNRGKWYVSGADIYFYNQGLIDEYNKLVNKIIEDTNTLAHYESQIEENAETA